MSTKIIEYKYKNSLIIINEILTQFSLTHSIHINYENKN